jgi:hypothetical protein
MIYLEVRYIGEYISDYGEVKVVTEVKRPFKTSKTQNSHFNCVKLNLVMCGHLKTTLDSTQLLMTL